jgi:hypothetical protein
MNSANNLVINRRLAVSRTDDSMMIRRASPNRSPKRGSASKSPVRQSLQGFGRQSTNNNSPLRTNISPTRKSITAKNSSPFTST